MICVKCDKEMLECRCPDAIERLRWLLSCDSPVVFDSYTARLYQTRIKELRCERALDLRRVGRPRSS